MHPLFPSLFLAATTVVTRVPADCSPVPLYEGGQPHGAVCPANAPDATIVSLADDWAPGVFGEEAERPPAYRARFVALANETFGEGDDWQSARSDRYFELFGVFPSFAVIRARLLDEARHRCHAGIDGAALSSRTRPHGGEGADAPAIEVAQAHLRCERLLAGGRAGAFDVPTSVALRIYQRRHMLPSPGTLDRETRQTLATDSRELDFRTLLRTLRERVVDATGLIEDGSARNAPEQILGRWIESPEYRTSLRPAPLPTGAPDLIARATEAAAVALGWTSPEAAAHALALPLPPLVALRLPALPPYHGPAMRLRAEIDRGDVWTSFPLDAEGQRRPSPARWRPCLTLFAATERGEVALVRWPTTIGAWKPEKVGDDRELLRYKPSPTGRWYWRELVAGPAWLPPPTTPDRELLRRNATGAWAVDQDSIGPGYRSAFGLAALLHQRPAGADAPYFDFGIRTHGSGNYRSILRGSSHGCHRLFNHLALRLGSFVLAHAEHEPRGEMAERYARTLHHNGRTFHLRVRSRGYLYVLTQPIPVDVLPGRIVRSRPIPGVRPAPVPST